MAGGAHRTQFGVYDSSPFHLTIGSVNQRGCAISSLVK